MRVWEVVLVVQQLVAGSLAIKCFTCDLEQNITCPGWDR